MPASNAKVADLLRRYARTLQLQGVDRFKIKAYQRAAQTLESTHLGVAKLVERGEDLQILPGVGKAISAKIRDIVKSGSLPQLVQATSKLEPELVELADKPLLDPRQVRRVYKKFKIRSLRQLKKRLDAGDIGRELGSRVESHVRLGLDDRPRILLWDANSIANQFKQFLDGFSEISRADITGSLRRKKETIGDLNFLAATRSAGKVFKHLTDFPGILSKEKMGRNEFRLLHSSRRTMTVRCVVRKDWGLAQVMATGSTSHLEQLRQRLFQFGKRLTATSLGTHAATEASVYKAGKLTFIEPELREGTGEIIAAAKRQLPKLIAIEDLRGDLHMHTTASDGQNSIKEMATAARGKGYEYIAITDHSRSLKITNGLSSRRLRAQHRAIDKINSKLTNLVILKSAEVDILENGKLDYPDSVLRDFDMTICSIHSRFGLDKKNQTERIMRAMDNRHFNILGHCTGRLLLKRDGYEIEFERLLRHAKECSCYFEINSSPDRLDLSDERARMAKEAGIKIAINTDAHSLAELDFMSAGINQARRAWLEPKDVLNSFSLARLKKLLMR